MNLVYLVAAIYTLAFMVNFLGCMLYLTARLEDAKFKGTWLEGHNGTDLENYLTSIFWIVTTVSESCNRHKSHQQPPKNCYFLCLDMWQHLV